MDRLPMRYRVVVWLVGVACFAGLGGWSAASMTPTTTPPALLLNAALLGGSLGVLLGCLVVTAFVRALETPDTDSASVPLR